MKTIAIIGQKGGTGKTALAKILLTGFAADGFVTVGIDLDPQCSLSAWGDLRGDREPEVISMQPLRLAKNLPELEQRGAEICVIDTAGRAEEAASKAIQIADLVIVPFQATSDDLMTAQECMRMLRNDRAKDNLAVLTRVKPQGTRHIEAGEYLTGHQFAVCEHVIGERVSYQDAFREGSSPLETEPESKAAHECRQIVMTACRQLGMTVSKMREAV